MRSLRAMDTEAPPPRTVISPGETVVVLYRARPGPPFGATYIGPGVLEQVGFPAETLVEDPGFWFSRLHPEDQARVPENLEDLLRKGAHAWDYRFRDASGKYHWMRDDATLVRTPDGEPLEITGAWIDVTALHRATEEARARARDLGIALDDAREHLAFERAKYEGLFQECPDGAALLLPDGTLVEANQAAGDLMGYTPRELQGMHIADLHPPEEHERAFQAFERLVREGKVVEDLVFQRRDGTTFRVEVSARMLRIGSREVAVGLIRSVEERLRAAEELEETRAQLRHSQRLESLGRLAGGVAHDFNNSLSVITCAVELLLDDLREGDPMRGDLETIRDAAERSASLTRQLLAFGRKQVLRPELLHLHEQIGRLEPMLRRVVGEDVTLSLDLDPEAGRVSLDPVQLEQVLLNLVLNARDALRPDGGNLTVAVRREPLPGPASEDASAATDLRPGDPAVRLSVMDDGPGIPEELRDQVFEPFFTTKEAGKGTGLGLASVYGIVKQSRGEIRIDDAPDGGCAFHVYLPLAGDERRASPVPARPASSPGGARRVLLVEDEGPVRALAHRVLEQRGFLVWVAGGGEEALRILEERSGGFHVLVSDVMMPDMGGVELARRVHERWPKVATLLMTGHSEEVVEGQGIDPSWSLLRKPFSPDALVEKVQRTLLRRLSD